MANAISILEVDFWKIRMGNSIGYLNKGDTGLFVSGIALLVNVMSHLNFRPNSLTHLIFSRDWTEMYNEGCQTLISMSSLLFPPRNCGIRWLSFWKDTKIQWIMLVHFPFRQICLNLRTVYTQYRKLDLRAPSHCAICDCDLFLLIIGCIGIGDVVIVA